MHSEFNYQAEKSFFSELHLSLKFPSNQSIAACQYDIKSYKSNMFNCHGVDRPTSIANAVTKRQAEYLAGRVMAQKALNSFWPKGIAMPQILSRKDRSPVWPHGYCGSISHTKDKAVCIIAKQKDWQVLGIDIEDIISEKDTIEFKKQIHTVNEEQLLTKVGIKSNVATTLIFSAKESLYKGLSPIVGYFFDFEHAEIIAIDTCERKLLIRLSDSIFEASKLSRELICHYELKPNTVITLLYF